MSDPILIPMEDLMAAYASDEQVKEANAFRTLPTGVYAIVGVDRADAIEARDTSPWPGRPMLSAFVSVENLSTGRKGKIGFDASWRRELTRAGTKQDGPSNLWGNIVKATGTEGRPVSETIESFKAYFTGLNMFVLEAFKKADGSGYVYPKTEVEVKAAVEEGLEAKNFVQNLSKRKASA